MDNSIQYAQVMSNFDSVYNAAPNLVHHYPITYRSTSSLYSNQNQSISPPLNSSNTKFNFDLYKPHEYLSESIDYCPSPSSSVIIHHHPVYSPPPPPPPSQAISKLRQINDELCYTLAQSEFTNHSLPPRPQHYHVHHCPAPHDTYRSHASMERDSSTESEKSEPKKRNARITYKVHIPRRQRQRQNSMSKVDQLLMSTSDAYLQNDPMTVDLYPTQDQGFVRKIRNRPDNQSPWLANTSPVRRNSYSEASTYRTPRAPDYDNKLIQPKSRLSDCKERPRSTSVKSRFRPDSAPNPLRQSASSFFSTAPTWRPSGAIKPSKFMGSNAPPTESKSTREAPWKPAGITNKKKPFRAFDPTSKAVSKTQEPIWRPPSKNLSKKNLRYFEPAIKPELIAPFTQETELVVPKKTRKNQPRMSSANPELKKRIINAESKVKSAWDSTAASTTTKEPRPPIPRAAKPTTATVPKTKVKSIPSQPIRPVKKVVSNPPTSTDTGRSSLNEVPKKPLFQSTPRNQSIVQENDNSIVDLFDNESQISEPTERQGILHPQPQIEKTPPKLPNTTVPEPDKETKSTIKDGVLIHGDDADNLRDTRTPSPTSEINNKDEEEEEVFDDPSLQPTPILPKRKESSPKPDNRDDDDAVIQNENDTDDDAEPSLSQAAVSSKENKQQISSTPPPATTNNEADDFFD
ncbi:unnamed protein product [Adineta steineri]|uniref:Uncharacterized protein n=1 Tax=Adineta steineri TaxID=433720 RepID=A0A818V8X7_9BILA|nr:unnamed protein product [Adineta steineri]CAF3702900.1 unnamed protein product [Adineta steineri]